MIQFEISFLEKIWLRPCPYFHNSGMDFMNGYSIDILWPPSQYRILPICIYFVEFWNNQKL